MTGPIKRPSRPFRRPEATLPDAVLTQTLADRIRREVALEKATAGDSEAPPSLEDEPVVVVLGPDGVPQIADDVEAAPATVKVKLTSDVPPKQTR